MQDSNFEDILSTSPDGASSAVNTMTLHPLHGLLGRVYLDSWRTTVLS